MSSQSHHTRPTATERWATEVVPRLPHNLEAQAVALGALRRHRGFASATLLLRGLLADALQASSLSELAAWGVLSDVADLAASAWLKRLRAATPWLSWLLSSLLGATPAVWLSAYGRWRAKVIDITTVGQSGGTGDDWRVHVSYDLLAGQFSHLVITDRSKGEHLDGMQREPRDIAIVDAGDGRRHHIAAVAAQSADMVVRVYLPTCPIHDHHGKPLDLVKQLERRGRTPLELHGCIEHGRSRIRVRVIAVPLPRENVAAAQQRLRKTARRKGRTASRSGLLLASWLVLVTTLPAEPWTAPAVVQLYRAGWQVEVVFKRLKQLLRLHQLRCTSAASAVPLLTLYLLAWVLSSEVAQGMRRALAVAAAPAPVPRPGHWPEHEAVVSSWRVQQVSLDLLRQQVWGEWTAARLRECLPRLVRHLVTHPRQGGRDHQETVVRAHFTGQRFTRLRPLTVAE